MDWTQDPRVEVSDSNAFEGTICTVVVGTEGTKFLAHEGFLTSQSKFFKAALSKAWREGKEGRIALPDDQAAIVRTYIHCLYTKTLSIIQEYDEAELEEREEHPEYFLLADLYVFGEKVQDRAFKDCVMDAFFARMRIQDSEGLKWFPGPAIANKIYSSTMAGSPARQLMFDIHISTGDADWITPDVAEYHPEFLVDVLRLLFDAKPTCSMTRFLEIHDSEDFYQA